MADCSNVIEFHNELRRLCSKNSVCCSCLAEEYCKMTENHLAEDFDADVIKNIINTLQIWSDENTPQIDWTKVPVGTKVLVRNSEEETCLWIEEYFVCYLPAKVEGQFVTFSQQKKQDDAEGVYNWKYCKLYDSTKEHLYYKE